MSDRAVAVLIVVVVVAIMGTLGVRYYLDSRQPVQEEEKQTEDQSKSQTAVAVRVTHCGRDESGRTQMTGYIDNVGNVDLHYVTVNAIWKNADGLPISIDRIYALRSGKLAPGASKQFQAFTYLPAARCNAEAVDWW